MGSPSAYDAGLFSALSEALHDVEQRRERRGSDRHNYDCVQLICPCKGDQVPENPNFCEVRCHDLSPEGFSFLSDTNPDFEYLVVALGQPPFKLFMAQVKRVSEAPKIESEEYLVGCRFVHRITSEEK